MPLNRPTCKWYFNTLSVGISKWFAFCRVELCLVCSMSVSIHCSVIPLAPRQLFDWHRTSAETLKIKVAIYTKHKTVFTFHGVYFSVSRIILASNSVKLMGLWITRDIFPKNIWDGSCHFWSTPLKRSLRWKRKLCARLSKRYHCVYSTQGQYPIYTFRIVIS